MFRETALTHDASKLVISQIKGLVVFDVQTGAKLVETATPAVILPADKQEQLEKTKSTESETTHVRYLTISRDDKYVVGTLDDSKAVVVLDIETLKLVNQILLPKRPCCLDFADDGETLIVGDKFGDVYKFGLLEGDAGFPILGHVSMLVDLQCAKANDQQYIITADRDEHIRVTKYPQSYIIDKWLFGHLEFVSTLALVSGSGHLLLSAGGDDFLALWDWTAGSLENKLDLRKIVGEDLSEIAVKQLIPVGPNCVVVLIEKFKSLLWINVENNTLTLGKAQEQNGYPISGSYENGVLVVALVGGKSSIVFYNSGGEETLKESSAQITQHSGEVEEDSEVLRAFSLSQLRKRAEH